MWFSFCFLYNGNFINLIVMSLALRPAIGVAVRGCVCLACGGVCAYIKNNACVCECVRIYKEHV